MKIAWQTSNLYMGSGDGDFPMIKKLSGYGTLFWIIEILSLDVFGAIYMPAH